MSFISSSVESQSISLPSSLLKIIPLLPLSPSSSSSKPSCASLKYILAAVELKYASGDDQYDNKYDLVGAVCDMALNSSSSSTIVHSLSVKILKSIRTTNPNHILMRMRSMFHVYLVTKELEIKRLCEGSMRDVLREVFSKVESIDCQKSDVNDDDATDENYDKGDDESGRVSDNDNDKRDNDKSDTEEQEVAVEGGEEDKSTSTNDDSGDDNNDNDDNGDNGDNGDNEEEPISCPPSTSSPPPISPVDSSDSPQSKHSSVSNSSSIQSSQSHESLTPQSTQSTPSNPAPSTPLSPFPSIHHRDAILLFRALCKLSSKLPPSEYGINSDTHVPFLPSPSNSGSDPLALQSKVLSLSLLLCALNETGDKLKSSNHFTYAIRHYLCVSLLKNSVHANSTVVYLSLRIFLVLVKEYWDELKGEIEVFIANVFLRVLDSPNSTYSHKCLVLEAISLLTSSPSTLTNLFLTYDCDLKAKNDIFKSVVNQLGKVAKGKGWDAIMPNARSDDFEMTKSPTTLSSFISGKGAIAKREAGKEASLRNSALEVLLNLLTCMLSCQGLKGGDEKVESSWDLKAKVDLVSRLDCRCVSEGMLEGSASDDAKNSASVNSSAASVISDASSPTTERRRKSVNNALCEVATVASYDDNGDESQGNRTALQVDLATASSIDPTGDSPSMSSVTSSVNSNYRPRLPSQDIYLAPSSSFNDEAPGSVSNNYANSIVSSYNQKRANKEDFETGLVKFKLSIKGGLLHFVKSGFVESLTARSVALFLYVRRDDLDKTQVGELLGKEPDYCLVPDVEVALGGPGVCVEILHEYVDNMNFADMKLDEAIRLFLSGFRLPGEAQKIDRIMEKFAERYSKQNPSAFPSPDTAFILAFSIIMLNTDLHNPSIPDAKKMTVDDFIRNNRGISDGEDLPHDMLRGVFRRIQRAPFSLKEDDYARKEKEGSAGGGFEGFFSTGSLERRRKEEFQRERHELMSTSGMLLQRAEGKKNSVALGTSPPDDVDNDMLTLTPAEAVGPMFDVAWGPVIGTLSQILEFTEDPKCISLCLRGFVYAVRIASYNEMHVARDTFVNSLAKFTTLGSIKEIKKKNIECIRTLLSIAISDGERLCESWAPVLQCVSQLARLQLYASGLATDDELFESRPSADSQNHNGHGSVKDRRASIDNGMLTGVSGKSSIFGTSRKSIAAVKQLEQENGRAVLEAVNEDLIDKIFANSVSLSVDGITHFITQLIQVSASEVGGEAKRDGSGVSSMPDAQVYADSGGARIFALQRIVEVADFNMNVRPR